MTTTHPQRAAITALINAAARLRFAAADVGRAADLLTDPRAIAARNLSEDIDALETMVSRLAFAVETDIRNRA